ncbi:HAMP domain-containing protein [Nocardia yamanashiensis]|uniref:adenylate/guanylate cyclase domain-containing protein n=1 Tax=Nocardia yamanashiensis TaxID=209247 RepID=UPI000AA5B4F7|nr:adenylate/guanylate cyclase domain-containing protein [Nocardia yamanashiensis]UGT38741.1 HAMP domain-containing protein [Nocardia yamanashiensis]
MISKLIYWALRARWGLSAVVMACNLSGLAVITTELWLSGFFTRLGDQWVTTFILVAIYPTLGASIGIVLAVRDRTHYFGWLDQHRPPAESEARRLLKLPMDITLRALAIWLPGVIIAAAIFAHATPQNDFAVVLSMFTLGGLESAALTYLIVDRLIRPTIPVVAEVTDGTAHWSSTVLVRVLVTFAVAGAVPLFMLITVLADPSSAPNERIRTGIYLALVGLSAGAVATAALSRAVASPMHTLRDALDRIARGDLDVNIPIGSTSEIGRLEHSVNELATNLRERERMRSVFDRHVGTEVAARALAGTPDLTGDLLVVTALFVDVTGSVALSTELAPRDFVAKLNRLLAIVVAATEDNHGLVNKFEGDAALCIFGAPVELENNATPALRAARRIRDEVAALGELDVGIGLARGLVFAGDVGADTRLEFTVIGDAVNEAARLTTEAKQVPRRILASQSVIDAASEAERDRWQLHDILHLRGRKQPTPGWTDTPSAPKAHRNGTAPQAETPPAATPAPVADQTADR